MPQKIIRRQSMLSQEAINFSSGLHPVLETVYRERGITDEKALKRELMDLLPDDTLSQIAEASSYLADAVQQQKRLLVFGDFDADGATGTALAVSALKKFGAREVNYLVPNRFEYGYGLTPEIIPVAQRWEPDVIITVDNGIASMAGVALAKDCGIDVIITDHHLPGSELPPAVAIVNPNQVGDVFPSKNLAGVGVIFYVMLALRRELLARDWFKEKQLAPVNMAQFLDLVALGTIADVVPLDQNNRILVYQGLARIRKRQCRPGIAALLQVAKRELKHLTSTDLAYAIAPRLNAAGRLEDMSLGIACLLSENNQDAIVLAEKLDQLNLERREVEASMQMQAESQLEKLHLNHLGQVPSGICLYQPDWHQGVIGIIAGRIKDQYYRPTIVFAKMDELSLKGSARSISGVNIRDILATIASQHPGLIAKFGGHAMAAGLTLSLTQFSKFTEVFQETLAKQVDASLFDAVCFSDGALSPEMLTLDVAQLLVEGGPWGQGFPEPCFDGIFIVQSYRILAEKHLKMVLAQTNHANLYQAILFNATRFFDDFTKIPPVIHAVYRLGLNYYGDMISLQLRIENCIPFSETDVGPLLVSECVKKPIQSVLEEFV